MPWVDELSILYTKLANNLYVCTCILIYCATETTNTFLIWKLNRLEFVFSIAPRCRRQLHTSSSPSVAHLLLIPHWYHITHVAMYILLQRDCGQKWSTTSTIEQECNHTPHSSKHWQFLRSKLKYCLTAYYNIMWSACTISIDILPSVLFFQE